MKKELVGRLDKHQHFKLRENGRNYTVHAQVIEKINDGQAISGRGDFFTIAVCSKRFHVFHYTQKVLIN